MNSMLYVLIYIAGVFVSSVAQIILKKSSGKQYKNKIFEYLNPMVIISYVIFFGATFCTIFAYKGVPLSMGPILAASEYLFVAALSKIILKETINKKKLMGLVTIIFGIILYSIKF